MGLVNQHCNSRWHNSMAKPGIETPLSIQEHKFKGLLFKLVTCNDVSILQSLEEIRLSSERNNNDLSS